MNKNKSPIIFNSLNSKHHKLSLENQVAMIGTSLVNISGGTRQQKHPEQGKQTTTYKQPSKQVKTKTPEPSYYMSHWISQMNISTGPSVRCQVFPILPCVSPSVWHGFWSQPTLV